MTSFALVTAAILTIVSYRRGALVAWGSSPDRSVGVSRDQPRHFSQKRICTWCPALCMAPHLDRLVGLGSDDVGALVRANRWARPRHPRNYRAYVLGHRGDDADRQPGAPSCLDRFSCVSRAIGCPVAASGAISAALKTGSRLQPTVCQTAPGRRIFPPPRGPAHR